MDVTGCLPAQVGLVLRAGRQVGSGVISRGTRGTTGVFPQKPPVAQGDSTRSINPHYILVALSHLHHHSSFIPLGWAWSGLILDPHIISNSQWWQGGKCALRGVLAFGSAHVAVVQSL